MYWTAFHVTLQQVFAVKSSKQCFQIFCMEDLFCHELISVLLKNGSVQCEKRFNVMRTTLFQIRLCIHIILSEPLFAVWILPIHFF